MTLFLSSGCRLSELSGLDVADIDLENKTAVVLGKGSRIRRIHFSKECAFVLRQYLAQHPGHGPLFLNCRGNRLGNTGIFKIVKRIGRMANLPDDLSPHKLRHTFATNLLARGADLQFIATELGHSNLNVTQRYTRIPNEDLIMEYRRAMD